MTKEPSCGNRQERQVRGCVYAAPASSLPPFRTTSWLCSGCRVLDGRGVLGRRRRHSPRLLAQPGRRWRGRARCLRGGLCYFCRHAFCLGVDLARYLHAFPSFSVILASLLWAWVLPLPAAASLASPTRLNERLLAPPAASRLLRHWNDASHYNIARHTFAFCRPAARWWAGMVLAPVAAARVSALPLPRGLDALSRAKTVLLLLCSAPAPPRSRRRWERRWRDGRRAAGMPSALPLTRSRLPMLFACACAASACWRLHVC